MQKTTLLKVIPLLFLTIFRAGHNVSGQSQAVPEIPANVQFAGINVRFDSDARKIVEADVKNLMQNKKYWEDKLDKALLYFPIIEGILIDEEVPIDFKYLAAQESGFNPDAFSSSSAVGFWQFKQETARELGLRVDDEVDERKSINASTEAAARYLKRSNQTFNNWVSSLYSYYLGVEGVKSLIPPNWNYAREVSLTARTDRYMLRFFAYKIAYELGLEKYRSSSPIVLVESPVGKNRTLTDVAKDLNINVNDIKQYNRWLITDRVPGDKEYVVLVPTASSNVNAIRDKLVSVQGNVDRTPSMPEESSSLGFPNLKKSSVQSGGYSFYEINGIPGILARPGDDARAVAKAGNLKSPNFLKYNDMSPNDRIIPGEVYYLARKNKRAATDFHTVRGDESMQRVSQIYGIRLRDLMKYNRIQNRQQKLENGRVLWLTKKRPKRTPIEVKRQSIPTAPPASVPVSEPAPEIAARPADTNTNESSTTAIPQKAEDRKKYTPKMADNVEPAPSRKGKTVQVIEAPDNDPASNNNFQTNNRGNNRVVVVDGNRQNSKPADTNAGYRPSTAAPVSNNNAETISNESVRYHTVERGQTFYSISRLFNLSVGQLLQLNNLTQNDKLEIGQRLIVNRAERSASKPAYNAPVNTPVTTPTPVATEAPPTRSAATGTSLHRVNKGETLYSISRKYDLTIHQLAKLNNLSINDKVVIGQQIIVKESPAIAGQEATNRPSASPGRTTLHTVVRGETLFSISKKYNLTISQIQEFNNLTSNSVQLGQKLKIPNQ